jgi:hypothetical protein
VLLGVAPAFGKKLTDLMGTGTPSRTLSRRGGIIAQDHSGHSGNRPGGRGQGVS